MSEQNFVKVIYKKRGRSKIGNISDFSINSEVNRIDKDKIFKRVLSVREELSSSIFYKTFISSLSKVINERDSKNIKFLICFGLGHFSDCPASQYQLGLLLNLRAQFGVNEALVHDPIFYNTECEILRDLGLKVVLKNEEAKYVVEPKAATLIYFPHCPKQLMNNFLWKNWGNQLENCVIIGNSFAKIIEANTSKVLKEQASYIQRILPCIIEHKIENNFKYTDIFNDTSIHIFSKENIGTMQSSFWNDNVEPQYSKSDVEYITSSLKSSLDIF